MKKTALSFLLLLLAFSLQAQDPQRYQLSTHILDISQGRPASGVMIHLYKYDEQPGEWVYLDGKKNDENGRIGDFLPLGTDNEGIYKLRFETADYFMTQGLPSIYPYVEVVFTVSGQGHYHIPITLSANGYSTYRGN